MIVHKFEMEPLKYWTMAFHSVLLEYEDREEKAIYTSSGILFGHKYIITTTNCLMSLIKQAKIGAKITSAETGVFHDNNVFSKEKSALNVITNENGQFRSRTALITKYFLCDNVKSSSTKILRDWEIDGPNEKYNKDFLSLFFILEIQTNIEYNFERAITDFYSSVKSHVLTIGKSIYVKSTPFGNRNFLNSYSQGIVSNILGENSCFILSDCPTVPGSEGSPMYIQNRNEEQIVGIVLASLSWWKGEWIGLTLGVRIEALLEQFFQKKTEKLIFCTSENRLLSVISKSLLQIVCGSSWGTGIIFDEKTGTVITNSHVIAEISRPIWAHWNGNKFLMKRVFSTPENEVYDIAVLKCENPEKIAGLNLDAIEVSKEPLKIGDLVYSAGYSLFSTNVRANATLTKGHVSQTHVSMLKTTCCVHPGSSGGAILRPNGKLAAIIVSNTKLQDNGVIYPRINMSIPILSVYQVIKRYLETNDDITLKKLHTTDPNMCKPWRLLEGKL